MKRVLVMSTAAMLAACAHAPAPILGPAPANASGGAIQQQDPTPATQQADTGQRTDSSRKAEPSTSDSAQVSASEVSKRAAEVFGDSNKTVAAASDSSNGPSWDIDVHSYETTARVEHYLRVFSGSSREEITAQLQEGTRYEPMIRAKMQAGGLPGDMYYLALIESGFDPNAYSRAAAVGMWQFMASTARDMGLRVDWWVDERRDPVKSTNAAVGFIRDLKEQLGSLYLAAAAYNGGPARIARGLTRYADDLEGSSGDEKFFALADKDFLPRETREYVPQLIAAALIAKEPQRYGMQIKTLPAFVYDSVKVGPATPLAAIAKASGVTLAEIVKLNPQVLRGMTPPRDSLRVRIPRGAAATFDSALSTLPKEERIGVKRVETKKGDYPETVAERYHVRTKSILLFNPKAERSKKTGRLAAGQVLLIPIPAVAAAATDAPDPSIERYSHGTRTHVVRRGESLGSIARKYHTTVKSIMALNGMKRSIIFPGQSLVVTGRPRATAAHRSGRSTNRGGKTRITQAGAARSQKAKN